MRLVLLMGAAAGVMSLASFGCSAKEENTSGTGPANATNVGAPSPSGEGTTTPPKKEAPPIPSSVTPTFDAGLLSTCTPAANPGEIYAFNAMNLAGTQNVSMCTFRQKVTLIVNVASHCGNTPQYAPLQTLWETYRDQGFYVLAFPCNQFGAQESGTAVEISEFCNTKYGITFPMFQKTEVNGASANPLYVWLKAQPGGAGDIEWNFAKFLVGRDGKLIKRYPASSDPGEEPLKSQINADIQAALAK